MGNIESTNFQDSSTKTPTGLPDSPEMIPGTESFKLSILFNSLLLHEALRLDKSEKIERFQKILSHKSSLQDWLRELSTKGDEWVSKEDMVDKLVQSGIPQENALQFFTHLDDYTIGRLHLPRILDELDNETIRNDIPASVSRLSACVMLPSILDVFLQGDTLLDSQREQARMLNTYVKNCCAPIKALANKELQSFFLLSQSRQQLIKTHFEKFGKTVFEAEKNEDALTSLEGYQMMHRCFSSVQVSSNPSRIDQLFDDNSSTFWQSSGTQGAHFIKIFMLPQVFIEQLSITISSTDNSYTPRIVEVAAGPTENSLRRVAYKTFLRRGSRCQTEVLLNFTTTYYRIIQINIKECAQDGCDTKIRGLHIQGYRSNTIPSFSEQEATYSWLLCILTATASISIATNPTFRNIILTQSNHYLKHITPLSLSSSSDNRPVFINTDFVEQLHTFFNQLLDTPADNQLDLEAYNLLLQFSLAHGYMHLLMPLLQRYINTVVQSSAIDSLRLPCVPLLNRLTKVIQNLEADYVTPLSLRIEQVEGFSKPREELSGLLNHESINPESSDSIAYVSKEDCCVLDLILTESKARPFSVRKLNVLKKDDKSLSPHLCLLFVVPSQYIDPESHKPTNTKQLFELYAKYDNWTIENWNKSQKEKQTYPDLPVACFDMTTDNWSEYVSFDRILVASHCCMVKLIRPKREETGEDEENKKTFSVYALQLFGDIDPSIELQRISNILSEFHTLPLQDSALVDSTTLIFHLFSALISLVRNQIVIINRNSSEVSQAKKMYLTCFVREAHINLDNLSFLAVWNVFLSLEEFGNKFPEHRALSLEIASQLILNCMPFFVTFEKQKRNKECDNLKAKQEALEHILEIINDNSVSEDVISALTGVLETGVLILFPEEDVRVDRLLEGVKLAASTETHPRAQIQTVSALIHYFSSQGVNKSLLGLPNIHEMDLNKEIELDVESIITRVTPFYAILYQRSLQQVESFTTKSENLLNCINIIPLLSSIQNSILNWSYTLALSDKATEYSANFAKIIMCRYLNLIERDISHILKLLNQHIAYEKILDAFNDGLISVILPELVSALHVFISVQGIREYVLHTFQGIVHKFTELAHSIPEFQYTYGVTQQNPENLLSKWERECAYDNYSNKEENEVFMCCGASYLVIEFDNRCNTDSGYDHLEFSDKDGKKYNYSGKVGSSNWPYSITIKGDKLKFRYKSDGGEFFYKFVLSAYGPSGPLHWFRDLYMSLASLFGRFCGENLKINKDSPTKTSLTEEEVILLKSDIGKSIFRGGLQKSRFVRSYSGVHQANTSTDTLITQFLDQMINEEGTTKSQDFLQVCQLTFKQPRYGGYLADKAVRATFAALLWHSQEMREEVGRFESKKETSKISSLITATYRLAESVRPDLLAAKQVLIQKNEDTPDKHIDSDLPLINCIDKAKFLLRFAGLSRITEADKTSPKRSKFSRKKSKLGVSQLIESDPYKELILNFVRRDSYSLDRIQIDMEERAKCAQNRSLTYNFTRDFVLFTTQNPPDTEPHQILSIYLTACFKDFTETPPHYGGNIDGCGLELENRVRESFYSLTQKLFQWIWEKNNFTEILKAPRNFKFLLSILHCLFNNLWNDFDFDFIHEHKLPRLLYITAINLLSITPKSDKEKSELSKVEDYIGWISLIQFHSLSLQLSSRIQDTSCEIEEQYINYAILLFVDCIRELIMSIRAGVMSVKQKEIKKKREEESNKEDKKDKVSKRERRKEEVTDKVTLDEPSLKEIPEEPSQKEIENEVSPKETEDELAPKDKESIEKPNNLITENSDTQTNKEETPVIEEIVKENEITKLNGEDDTQIPEGNIVSKEGTDDTLKLPVETKSIEDKNQPKMEFSASDTLELEPERGSVPKEKSGSEFTVSELKFGEENLTRNLCALGGLAPINPGHARWCLSDVSIQMVICHEVLPLLLDVIKASFLKNSEKIQLLAVSLLIRFVCRVDPQLVDEVMLSLNSNLTIPPSPSLPPGVSFILFLTNLGTMFLQKHKLIQATTVGHYLHQLLTEQSWMTAYLYNLQKNLDILPQSSQPASIFHLLVLAGFPELPAFGMQVEIEQKNSSPLSGLIVQAKEGSNSYEVILKNSRNTRNFIEKDVIIKPSTLSINDKSSLSHILNLTADCLRIPEKSVEQLYITFLLLKTITNYVQGDKSGETLHQTLQSGVLDLFTKLACKPTGIDKKWKIPELEHICMRSYQPEKNRSAVQSPLETSTKPDNGKDKSADAPKIDERDPLANISDEIRSNFFNLQTAFNCKLSVIRAAYEKANKDESTLIENLQRWLTDDKGFQIPEDIQEKSKSWEPLEEDPTPEIPEEMDETLDKGLPKYTPISVDTKEFAIAKDSDKKKKEKEILIPPDKTLKSEYTNACKDSLELFYSLENENLKRSSIKKLLSGLTVLQARQSLFSLIIHWNLEVPLCTAFLESMDVSRLFSLLQCAHKCLDEQKFDKMLDKLVTHISETTKKALGVEASKVLGPIKACTVTKESPHPNSKTFVESKIMVKNAIQYIITPDSQSCFDLENSVLFGSDSEFTENRKEMTGAEFMKEKCVVIHANTLYYKVKTPQLNMDWGWKLQVIVVTAGVLSCFDSACKLLERILSNVEDSNLLPLASVWENLFTACCFHPDEERFKIISLMSLVLKLFTTQNSNKKKPKNGDVVVSKPDPEQRIDLTLLRPLWNYYSKIIDQYTDEKIALRTLKVPPIARMLTDMFTQVELCATACGLERELRMSQVTDYTIDLSLQQGIQNVGLVSIGINSSNIVMEKFVQAKKDYKPSDNHLDGVTFPNLSDPEPNKFNQSLFSGSSTSSEDTSTDDDYYESVDSDWSID
ncbi:Zinc finger ZZ-type and EF-hand domain-containing protein 1 [Oopsacas minuta]|uniref:Zinc finger ZZ-type and EF-hand domain-containing protein 1 n=1 Tax=Oopsacas minuta TaxID=111878 RepID=A0AAV7K1R9_9METZ|nr:Zinc finger ZZ-type and EF-hand domain-containing protein 1 [Oopsacas minuta]